MLITFSVKLPSGISEMMHRITWLSLFHFDLSMTTPLVSQNPSMRDMYVIYQLKLRNSHPDAGDVAISIIIINCFVSLKLIRILLTRGR